MLSSPFQIHVNDIKGNRKLLHRLELDQAETTLGVVLAPDGNTHSQTHSLIQMATQWVDNVWAGKITRDDVWLVVMSTIWRTIAYPLPALNLTKQQCNAIIAPILANTLLALGVCRNFP